MVQAATDRVRRGAFLASTAVHPGRDGMIESCSVDTVRNISLSMVGRTPTALVALVAACWVVVFLFLALGLCMSDAPRAALGAFAVAFVGTWLACRLCAGALARSQTGLRLPVAAAFAAASLAPAYSLLWSTGMVNHRLTGPTSPSGLTVLVDVWDAHPGWSADFYSDVRVFDGSGRVVAEWKDDGGQYPCDGPRLLRDSMRWTSPSTLTFETRLGGTQRITVR